MAVLHITEAELARDLHAFLEKVRAGAEIVVEGEHTPVAVIRPAPAAERTLSEMIRLAEERERVRGYKVTLDEDYAADVEAVVVARRPWNPPTWD
jgi:antitoxin (DNA-binding transcriptional repressor) of toxin-antitoxin stability system